MAKVFAVVKNDKDELELLIWNSKKSFESENSWMDDKFLCLGSTDDYKNEGVYNSEKEHIDPDVPFCNGEGFRILASKESVEAHNMMHHAFKAHFKGKVFDEPIR